MNLLKSNNKLEIDVVLAYLDTGFLVVRLNNNMHAIISYKGAGISVSKHPMAFIRGKEKIRDIPKEYIEKATYILKKSNIRLPKGDAEYPPTVEERNGIMKEFWEYYDTLPQIKVS